MGEWVRQFWEITFAYPHYLSFWSIWVGGVVGIVWAMVAKLFFRPSHTKDSRKPFWGRDAVWPVFGFLAGLMVVGMAGPQVAGFRVMRSGGNLDIVIGIDRSVSMAIADVPPSRHEAAKRAILNFVRSSAVQDGDRLTLFAFSEKANWRMPLSEDREEFISHLLDVEHPKDRRYYDRSQGYTDLKTILELIPESLAKQDRFFKRGPFARQTAWVPYPRIVFLFSDGDSVNENKELTSALAILSKQKIKVYTIGVGTLAGGILKIEIPNAVDPQKIEPLEIRSRLNMKALHLIKDRTGGQSYVLDAPLNRVQQFLVGAVGENRNSLPILVPAPDAKNFWWDVLAIPSLVLILFIIFKL